MEKYKRIALLKLTQLMYNNKIRKPTFLDKIKNDLNNRFKHVNTMKKVLSMQQQGYDMSGLHNDVLKLFNTNDVNLKMLVNYFIKSVIYLNQNNQVLYVNSFLKDYKNTNLQIKKLAIEDSIVLCNEFILRNYIQDIKLLFMSDDIEIKCVLYTNLVLFYIKSRELFLENQFDQLLLTGLEHHDRYVVIHTLKTLSILEKYENFVGTSKIFDLLKRFIDKNDTESLMYGMKILMHKKCTNITLVERMLQWGDVCIYYSSAIILLRNSKDHCQMIFDHGLSYLNLRKEQNYNILLFLLFLITNYDSYIKYDNKCFTIFEDDFLSIKLIKLRILTHKIDAIAFEEIKYLVSRYELLPDIYRICIEKDIYLPGILGFIHDSEINDVIKITLLFKDKFTNRKQLNIASWCNDLKQLLKKYNPKNQMIPYALEVASFVSDTIPEFVYNLKNNENLLVRYFLNMYFNGFIVENICLQHLKRIKNHNKCSRLITIIQKNIMLANPDSLIPFTYKILDKSTTNFNDIINDINNVNNIKSTNNTSGTINNPINDNVPSSISNITKTINYNTIELNENDLKNYETKKNKNNLLPQIGLLEDVLVEEKEEEDNFINNIPKSIRKPRISSELFSTSNSNDIYNKLDGFIIETSAIKGVFNLSAKTIKFFVESIFEEQPVYIKNTHGVIKTRICTNGEKDLYTLEIDDINQNIEISIGIITNQFCIEFVDLIRQIDLTPSEFHDKFNSIENYTIINSLDLDRAFFIEDDAFAFTLLGYEILGKLFGTQLIVKSDALMIKFLQTL